LMKYSPENDAADGGTDGKDDDKKKASKKG
jgi:hypothetical protein